MKTYKPMFITAVTVVCLMIFAFSFKKPELKQRVDVTKVSEKGCVFRTVMGEESSENYSRYNTTEKISKSIEQGLSWIEKAQGKSGGWGAGSHSMQHVTNPHAVHPDPATTSMVSMALLRTGNTLTSGPHQVALKKALDYLLHAVENSSRSSSTITNERGTQIQVKLGENIDVILTAQFLSKIIVHAEHDTDLRGRIKEALDECVRKTEKNQQTDGSAAGAGWAGVLQSAFATTALELAEENGIEVDSVILEKSRDYQKNNYDPKTGEAKTERGAGVVLYSVTGSARASAKEARKVKEDVEQGKNEGKISKDAVVDFQTLHDLGYSPDAAMRGVTAFEVYESAKVTAQQNDVMEGFGSNGGEEFLSHLQTGESMLVNNDHQWKRWFDNISGRLLTIQNANGSWNGHHCITSPVFCTATCLLILSVNNDIENLMKLGKR